MVNGPFALGFKGASYLLYTGVSAVDFETCTQILMRLLFIRFDSLEGIRFPAPLTVMLLTLI